MSFLEQFDRSHRRQRSGARAPSPRSIVFGVLSVIGFAAAGWILLRDGSVDVRGLLEEGQAAHEAGRLDEASERYEAVLDEDPENVAAIYNLGLIDQTEGRTVEAEASYREALRLDPSYVPALFNLAILRGDDGDHAAAVELYRLVLAVDPDHAAAHLNLGFGLISLGQVDAGRREIGIAAELDPALVDADGAVEVEG